MHLTKISQDFSVSSQITAADVTEIANAGFKSIICNRPDFEESTQPMFNDIAKAAHDAGLKTEYLPITAMPLPEQITEMANAISELPKPIFAYCRSGNRSSILFHAANG